MKNDLAIVFLRPQALHGLRVLQKSSTSVLDFCLAVPGQRPSSLLFNMLLGRVSAYVSNQCGGGWIVGRAQERMGRVQLLLELIPQSLGELDAPLIE